MKRLHDEVANLTAAFEAAIEEAIRNGQNPVDSCNDTPKSGRFYNKDLAHTRMNVDSRVVGWVDDF